MYTLTVQRNFHAFHSLPGNDNGSERKKHRHRYRVALRLEGELLDEQGYLSDIDDVGASLDRLIGGYKNKLLNELPSFKGLNPSIEHFARIFCRAFIKATPLPALRSVTVTIAENDSARASYKETGLCRRMESRREDYERKRT